MNTERTGVIKSTRRKLDDGDTDVFESRLYERYAARHLVIHSTI